MAFIVFKAKQEFIAACQLQHGAVMGRSLDCDVFVPDVFVSRQHCRFERTGEGWTISDMESRNGLFFHGVRIRRRVLKHADVLEMGTIQVIFHEADLPEGTSKPAPFGLGPAFGELVDTVFAENVRPMEYIRRNMRQPRWMRAVAAANEAEKLPLLPAAIVKEPDEWTELDIEFQIQRATDDLVEEFEEQYIGEDLEDWRISSLRFEEYVAQLRGETSPKARAVGTISSPASREGNLLDRPRPRRTPPSGGYPAPDREEQLGGIALAEPAALPTRQNGWGGAGGDLWAAAGGAEGNGKGQKHNTPLTPKEKHAAQAAKAAAKAQAKAAKARARMIDGVVIEDGTSLRERLDGVFDKVREINIGETIAAAIAAIIARPLVVVATLVVIVGLTIAVYKYTDRPEWKYRNVARPAEDSVVSN